MRPTIVCLCGSTRFKGHFLPVQLAESLEGRIVLTLGDPSRTDEEIRVQAGFTEAEWAEKLEILGQLHFRKIDLADEILVVDPGGYFGQHTRAEIDYAANLGKRIRYVSQEGE